MRLLFATALFTLLALPPAARAWSADGHRSVVTLAGELLRGTPAGLQVHHLLDGMTLQDASVWADCARNVDPTRDFAYRGNSRASECAPLETEARIAEMRDYVRRNHRQCRPAPGAEDCHRGYHYVNLAYQRSRHLPGAVGARPDDIVGATAAAISVLQGRAAPPPFGIASRREALLMLLHLVGDLHQPLHVAGVYLDAGGHPVDPDKTGLDPAHFTVGGNRLMLPERPRTGAAGIADLVAGWRPSNLHALWDGVPAALRADHIDARWVQEARRVPASSGAPSDWPALWAADALAQGRPALHDVTFGAKQGEVWPVTLPAGYEARMAVIKRRQLTLAGARLAEVLRATLAR
ncbi:MAG: S1/P1 nuclease [Roseateles sp.]|uniref:S1/P1 nuclease n=1 Tax=Roseateles sp. TaxID=1971397 RepID=UPI0040373AB7